MKNNRSVQQDHRIHFRTARITLFDFEGSMLKPIESFYLKFGGELTPYMKIWKNNLFNYSKLKLIPLYKKMKYGK